MRMQYLNDPSTREIQSESGKSRQWIENAELRLAASQLRLAEIDQRARRLKKLREACEQRLAHLRSLKDRSLRGHRAGNPDSALALAPSLILSTKYFEQMAKNLRCAEEAIEAAEQAALLADERILNAERCLSRAEEVIYRLRYEMLENKNDSSKQSSAERRIK